jgi:Ca2+-transporting ATPase
MKGQNKWLWGAGVLSLLLTSVVVLIDPIANVFGMVGIGWEEYLIAMALGFCIIPLVETVKFVHRLIDKKKA